MVKYFKGTYKIDSTRLPDYDYGSDGDYFLTICTKDKKTFFGEIQDDKIKLSQEGEVANIYWQEIPAYFPNAILDEFVIMPNHIHGIITIDNSLSHERRDAINRVSTTGRTGGVTGEKNPMNKWGSIPFIVRWFKGRASFDIRKMNSEFGWQARYYDHVIRDQKSFFAIKDYIKENPFKWKQDENNPKNLKVHKGENK